MIFSLPVKNNKSTIGCIALKTSRLCVTAIFAIIASESFQIIEKEDCYMNQNIGMVIRQLRHRHRVGQGDLAEALGVSAQAVSKWETGKANPDLCLLPELAKYFGISIDSLFADVQDTQELPREIAEQLEVNNHGWTELTKSDWRGTFLPNYGPYTPTEDQQHLLGDVRGKVVLEICCGCGESMLWLKEQGAGELWGLDISAERIDKAEKLLANSDWKGKLLISPMEIDPGIPHSYFDLVLSIYGLGWTTDLDKTIKLIGEYLKPGGRIIFSWDNPLMQCIDSVDGRYILSRSYVDEREIDLEKKNSCLHLHNWKLSTYLNCLANHGFLIEQVVEESSYDPWEADIFQEGKYYSAGLARFINNAILIKARKR